MLDGQVVAGELVRYAAERHMRDLRDGAKRGLHWVPEASNRTRGFFPACLTITAGAKEGLPFELLPWHGFCVGSLFGWKTASGRLRFRTGWFETGKGQAKSPLMAGVGLYLLGYHGVKRAEVYAIAQDKDQANVVFKDAVNMCRATIPGMEDGDTLQSRGEMVLRGTLDNSWKIEHPDTNSKFQALANGENISGPRPVGVLGDEVHEMKSNSLIETWKAAVAKMAGDAMMLLGTNTPSTQQIVGTEYSEFFQAVAKGSLVDDEAFSFIARVDKKDDPFKDESCWPKALPALGITFPVENVRGQVNSAKVLLSTRMTVKRLYFGIPVGSTSFWIDEEAWLSVLGGFDLEKLRGCPCWLSLDLSNKNDLTALTIIWLKHGHLYARTIYWTRSDGLADRARGDKAPYEKWEQEGHLQVVPGAVIDKEFVAAEVAELCAKYDVQFMAFDPAQIEDFISACGKIGFAVWKYEGPDEPEGEGLKLVPHAQGTRIVFEDKQLCMPRSIERLEDRILKKTITIEDCPVTYMCAGNAMVVVDAQKNRAFDKKRSRGRIDGLVTLAMAVGAATAEFKEEGPSVYETRGIVEIEV